MGAYGKKQSNVEFGRGAVRATLALLALLQLLLGAHLSVYGVAPDFMLVFTACVAFLYGSHAGCVAGFTCGLVFDLLGSGPVGVSALLGCVTGYVLGLRERNVFVEGVYTALVAFALASLAYNALHLILLFLLGTGVSPEWSIVGRVLMATVLDCIVAAAVFLVLGRACSARPSGPGGVRLP